MNKETKTILRMFFLQLLYMTGSMKIALEQTAEKFKVTKGSLKVDWFRRGSWPKEIFQTINDSRNDYFCLLEIRKSISQLESLRKRARKQNNINAELGAIKSKIDTAFKLVNLRRTISEEDFLERLEKLEAEIRKLTHGTEKK
jgi:hypothetical protein